MINDELMLSLEQRAISKALQALHNGLEHSYHDIDKHLVELEAEQEWRNEQMDRCEKQLQVWRKEYDNMDTILTEELQKSSLIQKQMDFLIDYREFVDGHLFQVSALGARFFTDVLTDFAYRLGVGETIIEEALNKSTDELTIILDGKSYCYFRGASGRVFFHPEPIENEVFFSGSLSDIKGSVSTDMVKEAEKI